MKFRKFGQIILASVVSLGLAAGITACSTARTIDYAYVISSKNTPGQINIYQVDSQSGVLHPLSGSPITMKCTNPVSQVVSPDSKNLYVACSDNTVAQYTIGTTGQLSLANSYTTPGGSPVSLAINAAGTYLYVADTYQPGFSSTNPGTGGALIAYPVSSDGSLGTPLSNGAAKFYAVGANPVAVNVLATNNAVFVAEKNDGTAGTLHAFTVGTGGALSPMGTSSLGAGIYSAGVQPSAVISDLTSDFVYVTDYKQNQIIGYTVQSSATQLVVMPNSPFRTGNQPISLTIDSRNKYMYVTNFSDGTLSGFQLDNVKGNLTSLAGGLKAAQTESEPTCVFIEPALSRYVYVTNFLTNTISGYKLDPNTGSLTNTQGGVVQAASGPVCGVAIAHGNHAVQNVDTGR